MNNKNQYSLEQNQKLKLNPTTSNTIKVKINNGTLSIIGGIESEEAVKTSVLAAIGDKDYTVVSEISDTTQIFTIDASGYDYIMPTADCVVVLYTERY